MNNEELYLIDGSAYIYRAYHAISALSNSQGTPTHAVYGFTTILRRILREKNPRYLAVAFDTRGPVFRHRLYPNYKAHRPPMPEDLSVQIPYIRKLVEAYRILCLADDDQEADDLIASVVAHFEPQGHKVVIVSGDKDLLQLVSENVSLWDPMSDKLFEIPTVAEKYGLEPGKLLDYFALVGDCSDNIPGVPGVGPKTAQKLIGEWGSLEELYQNGIGQMKASKMKERLVTHRDEAYLSRELVRLNQQVPVPKTVDEYRIPEPDFQALRLIFTELEFHTLLKDEVKADRVDNQHFQLVQTPAELAALLEQLTKGSLLILDTETTSLDPLTADLVGISLAVDNRQAWYIPLAHRDEQGRLLPGQLSREQVLQALAPFLQDPNLPKIGHNLKYDWAILNAPRNGSLPLTGPLYDTMIGAWLLDPGRRSYKLDDLCREINLELTSFAEVTAGDKRDDAFCRVPLEAAKNYSCEDVHGACLLFEQQQPLLQEKNIWELFTNLEGPLIPILAEMERTGIMVDQELTENLAREFSERLEDLENDIYRVSGRRFNINSPGQLADILFVDLNLPKGRKIKTGYSTDIKVLERLSRYHELPALILAYRNLAKLKSTYVDNLAKLVNKESGRIHTSFNQCGTATGRLSSSNPNLQNIPIRSPEGRRIRAAFIAAPGQVLISGDYSQIDLRVLAHYSQDPALLEAFHRGQDIHKRTAAEIFLVMPELITAEMRRVAKTINFGIVYGMSSFGLAEQLNISRKEAQVFIDRYFAYYQGIKNFMETIVEQARRDRFVTTLLGRRRQLPEISSSNRIRREFAERTAINTPIQGSAADIIKLAMLEVNAALRKHRLKGQMLLQIHDELVLEVPEDEVESTVELVRSSMENVMKLSVPLVVNLEVSKNLDKG